MKLKQGGYYTINLIEPYTSKGPFFVQFNAVVKKASMSLYGEFDIKGTFFENVGLLTYLSIVTDDTDIFICNTIKGTDPLEVDLGDSIALPVSIVDLNNCEQWFLVNRFQFNLEGVTRYLPSITTQDEFKKSALEEIVSLLNNSTSLAGDVLSIFETDSEYLMSDSNIKKAEDYRKTLIKGKEKRELALLRIKEQEYLALSLERKNLDKMILSIAEEREKLNKTLNFLNEMRVIHINFVKKVNKLKLAYINTYNTLMEIAAQLGQVIPTWEDVWYEFIGDGDPWLDDNEYEDPTKPPEEEEDDENLIVNEYESLISLNDAIKNQYFDD
jgi:hypothetical protein